VSMSLSRPMPGLVERDHTALAIRFRFLWSRLQEKRELVDIGAYAPGRDTMLDDALARAPGMEAFLRQSSDENIPLGDARVLLEKVLT
ncbi:MAG: hypothetical protein KGI94_03280, partial [Paracoccaceae bacterium]|nr:hypothetical protein [Paracoccaceae bacterium]